VFSVVGLLGVLVLASCSWSDPVRVESDFGDSVRNMIEQQKAVIPAAVSADSQPGLDGESARHSLDRYREAQKGKAQKQPLDTLVPSR